MKALLLTQNQQFELSEITLPELAATQCRIKLRNVGVCSSDVARSFANGAYFYPLIMGHEMAGEVVEIGSAVKDFAAGNRVVIFPLLPCFQCPSCLKKNYMQCRDYKYYGSRCHGGYAQYLDVEEWNLLKIPNAVDFVDACLTEPLSVVLHALNRAYIKQKQSIAIIGSGFLGLIAIQILRKKFPHNSVTAIDRNQFKLDLAQKYGANIVCLKNEQDWNEYLSSNTNGFDVVIEASGVAKNFTNAIKMTANAGTSLWMGNVDGEVLIDKKTISSVLRKELHIIGTWNSNYTKDLADDWHEALKLMEQGLKPSHLVSHFVKLEEVPEILQKIHEHKNTGKPFPSIKAVIKQF